MGVHGLESVYLGVLNMKYFEKHCIRQPVGMLSEWEVNEAFEAQTD